MRSTFYTTFTFTNSKQHTTDMSDDLRERLVAFVVEYNSSDIQIKESGNMPSHYQDDVNLYLLDKAANIIGNILTSDLN